MPRGTDTDPSIRAHCLALYEGGLRPSEIAKDTGIPVGTISSWVARNPSMHKRRYRGLTYVSAIREVLDMLDAGATVTATARKTGHKSDTVKRWRDIAAYREATYEYDPNFDYNPDDLLDRATVAAHLCQREWDPAERQELLFRALDSFDPELQLEPIPLRILPHPNDPDGEYPITLEPRRNPRPVHHVGAK